LRFIQRQASISDRDHPPCLICEEGYVLALRREDDEHVLSNFMSKVDF
jgi:hypothetical protein